MYMLFEHKIYLYVVKLIVCIKFANAMFSTFNSTLLILSVSFVFRSFYSTYVLYIANSKMDMLI